MNYEDRIKGYEREAEDNFSNYVSGGVADEWTNFNGVEELDPNDKTLTVKVVNASTSAAATATIFGSVFDLTDANLSSNITITVSESSHLKVKTELLLNPFRIVGLKYVVTTVAQLSNVLSLFEEKSTGGLIKRLWQPLNFRSAQNEITTQIDAPSFELLVTANTYIQLSLAASETVTFTFSLGERADLKNVLRGRSVRTVAREAAPTGLPQIDMKTMEARKRF